ncbi:MAG: cation-translocating P-type ATPase [Firmicutes bacterium]|nr:cation-translocating P-type ATPase [Bacillota bacterium]MBQ9016588.1 cation-translocating P-type ATPase [Bacillota bacterium]
MEERKAELQQIGGRIRENIIEPALSDREEKVLEDLKHRLIVSVIFAVPLLLVAGFEHDALWGRILEIVLLVPIVVVNHRVFIDGFTAVHSRRPEKNTLAAIGTIAALIMMQFLAAGVFLTTMALCRFSEAYVNYKLDDHLKKLIEAEPEDPGLAEGEVITVAAGERIPADGEILEGTTVIDEELITGERVPADRGPSDPVFAGTKNLTESFVMRVFRSGPQTTISRIIEHITASTATRAPIAQRAEKAARIFVLIVIILAALATVVWIIIGDGWPGAVMTGITILIIASPYAFSVGIPMCVLGATVRSAKNGILIRSADILELARDINTIAMNKTGTVTAGKPQISDVISIEDGFTLQLAGALEQESVHPSGKEICRLARQQYGSLPPAQRLEYFPGRGVKGIVRGRTMISGSGAFLRENGIATSLCEAEKLYTQGKSVIFYANENRVIGLIGLRDGPKPVSLKGISRIEDMGIDVVMLTGDSKETAEAIRSEVGIDRAFAELPPRAKADVIEKLQASGGKVVAMVGDGVDDAEAIAKADIGIAIGTGPAINADPADVILIADDLMDVVRAISLSRKTIRYIRQNMAFAYCYNILAIAAAAGILVPLAGPVLAPVLAALCMCISQILVVVSTMRVKTASL